jgi:hypothetical protein
MMLVLAERDTAGAVNPDTLMLLAANRAEQGEVRGKAMDCSCMFG